MEVSIVESLGGPRGSICSLPNSPQLHGCLKYILMAPQLYLVAPIYLQFQKTELYQNSTNSPISPFWVS